MTVRLENAYTAANPSLSNLMLSLAFKITSHSDPWKSRIDIQKTCILPKNYTMAIQSCDASGKNLDSKDDVYNVTITRCDGIGFD